MTSSQASFRPYWFEQALKVEDNPVPQKLTKDLKTDICIVGGGYTGLWSAILLKEKNPEKEIALIEQNYCGFGASGSNGGCVLTLSPKFLTLRKLYGEAEAKRLVSASEQAVLEIEQFVTKHNIECDLRIDGTLYISTNPAQHGSMQPVMQALEATGLRSWTRLNKDKAAEFSGTTRLSEGYFSPIAGSVQPALLVRGMARVAREMGIKIYEFTPMLELQKGHSPTIKTPDGTIQTRKLILATNAWMATQFKQFARAIVVVSSDMVITEPVPEVLASIGLDHGATICDSRIFVHYYHTTSDGRLMIGKGGNTFAYNSKMLNSFFKKSSHTAQLKTAINTFFPELLDIHLRASWNGGSDRSVTGFPFFGHLDEHPDIIYGFGYSGNGVAQSWIGGQILSSMALDLDDEWSKSGFVGGPRGKFPPEPVKWIGSMLVRNAIRRKEAAEDKHKKPSRIDTWLSTFAKAAGKADK